MSVLIGLGVTSSLTEDSIVAATKRWDNTPSQTISRAQKGSIPDLVLLHDMWAQQSFKGPANSRTLMDIFVSFLQDTSKIPKDATPESASSLVCTRALICLEIFGNPHLILKSAQDRSQLLSAWRDIFLWTEFFSRAFVLSPSANNERRRSVATLISMVWQAALACDVDATGNTPGLLEIAIRVFVQEYPGHPEMTARTLVPTIFLVLAGTMMKTLDRSIVGNRIRAALDGRPEVLGHAVLSAVSWSLQDANYSETLLEQLKQTMTMLLDAGDVVVQAYLKANGTRILAKALVKICAKMHTDGPSETLVDIAGDFCRMLEQMARASDGFPWAIDALNGGLLVAWADLAPYIHLIKGEKASACAIGLMEVILPRYFPYRSVLLALQKALPALKKGSHVKHVLSSPENIRFIYEELMRFAEDLLAALNSSTRYFGVRDHWCDNDECDVTGPKSMFKRCARCLSVQYCSKECQQVHWKRQGHKSICSSDDETKYKTDVPPGGSKSDAKFLQYIAYRFGHQNLPLLRDMARKSFREVPRHHLLIHINFSDYKPGRPYILSLKDLNTHDPHTPPNAGQNRRNEPMLARLDAHPDFSAPPNFLPPGFVPRPPVVITQSLPPLPVIRSNAIKQQVFTHRSFFSRRNTQVFEDPLTDLSQDNEKLEHLGDTVLGLVVTELLFNHFPGLRVGPATKTRSIVVGNATLARLSVKYKLPDRLRLHHAQAFSLRASQKIQADVFESFIGGLYLDRGLPVVKEWLELLLPPYILEAYNKIREQHGRQPLLCYPQLLPPNHTLYPFPHPHLMSEPEQQGYPIPPKEKTGHLALFNQYLQKSNKMVEWSYSEGDPFGLEEERRLKENGGAQGEGVKSSPSALGPQALTPNESIIAQAILKSPNRISNHSSPPPPLSMVTHHTPVPENHSPNSDGSAGTSSTDSGNLNRECPAQQWLDDPSDDPVSFRSGVGSKVTPVWTAKVELDGVVLGTGRGNTKKAARNEAAKVGLTRLGIEF